MIIPTEELAKAIETELLIPDPKPEIVRAILHESGNYTRSCTETEETKIRVL